MNIDTNTHFQSDAFVFFPSKKGGRGWLNMRRLFI